MKHTRKHYIYIFHQKKIYLSSLSSNFLLFPILSHHFARMLSKLQQFLPEKKNTDSSILLLAALHTRVRVQVSRLITDDESRVQPSKQRKGGRKSNIYHRPIFTARLLHCVPFLSHPLFPISICFFCRPTA